MPHGSIAIEFLALIMADNWGDLDSRIRYGAAMKTEPGFRIGPTFGKLSRIARRHSAVESDSIHDLNRSSSVDMPAE